MAEDNDPVILTFAGGVNARQRSADINIQECTEGQNFDLNFQSAVLKGRQQIGIVAIPPNGEPIRGIAQLVKPDGTLSTIIQAGSIVYAWDGANEFTEVGTVSPDARLRGPIDSNFTLDAFIILVDLAKIENVKKWNGETFQDFEHNLGVDFKAKYVSVQNERAIFANVKTGTADTPHIILGSKIGDSEILTVTDRPSSALGFDDPFFIPTPDLRPINGLVFFANSFLFSTERGRLYVLQGKDAEDFSIEDFHAGSAVSGDEALVNIGNDVAMGLPGRIETLSGVLEFGDVETNDASWWIAPLIDGTFGEKVSSWALAYDQTGQRVFCFPNTGDDAWVLHKSLLFGPNRKSGLNPGKDLSPWAKWVSTEELNGFNPTAIGNIFDQTETPRLLSTSPPAANTSSSGPSTPTLFFGFTGGVGGTIFSLKSPDEEAPRICDVDLVPTMTSNTAPEGIASASTESTNLAFEAFDDDSGFWKSDSDAPFVNQWLKYRFATPQVARAYTLDHATTPDPASWTFQGSDDDSSWTVLDSRTLGADPNMVVKYSFSNETAFRYYRWLITATNDVTSPFHVRIGEAQILSC